MSCQPHRHRRIVRSRVKKLRSRVTPPPTTPTHPHTARTLSSLPRLSVPMPTTGTGTGTGGSPHVGGGASGGPASVTGTLRRALSRLLRLLLLSAGVSAAAAGCWLTVALGGVTTMLVRLGTGGAAPGGLAMLDARNWLGACVLRVGDGRVGFEAERVSVVRTVGEAVPRLRKHREERGAGGVGRWWLGAREVRREGLPIESRLSRHWPAAARSARMERARALARAVGVERRMGGRIGERGRGIIAGSIGSDVSGCGSSSSFGSGAWSIWDSSLENGYESMGIGGGSGESTAASARSRSKGSERYRLRWEWAADCSEAVGGTVFWRREFQ